MGEKSIDVKSIMDMLYGESSKRVDSRFIFAHEGNKVAQEDEVIHLPKKDKDYSSFYGK